MKKPTSQLTQGQREMFTKLLEGAKARAASVPDYYDIRARVKAEMTPKLAEERGATVVVEKLQKLRREVQETENALRQLGFESNYCGELSIASAARKELRLAVDGAVKAVTRERDAKQKEYDRAILSVWTAENATEAKAIVEGLL